MKTWEKVRLYIKRSMRPAIAMLAALAMMLSAMPMTAYAADTHTHCVCGGGAVGVGDHTACTDTTWTELTQAHFDNAGEGTSPVSLKDIATETYVYVLAPGNYYLGEDIAISTSNNTEDNITDIWTQYGNYTTGICLNGKTLNLNNYTIRLDVDAKLNICDCQGEGSITSQALALYSQYSGSVCNMYSGTVLNSNTGSETSWSVAYGGTFNMYGGAINGPTYGYGVRGGGSGNMNMYGGTITGYTGIYDLGGNVTIRGGSISSTNNFRSIYFKGDALRLSGSPNIANAIYLDSGKFITVDGALSNDTPYLIDSVDAPAVFAKPDGTNVTSLAAYESNFTSRWSNYVVAVKGNDLELAEPHEHSYTYTASGNVITESCTCGHEKTATLNAPTGDIVYDGTAKEGATVSYSDGWLGGELTVTYSNNMNAGEATASITKDGVTATATFTINGATPAYTVPTGLTATYGDTLSQVTLPGSWAWKAPSDTVGNVGSNTFKAIYTPADTNYKAIEADVTVTVGKATPQYTVPMGVTATYGDTLEDIELSNWGSGWTWKDDTLSVGDVGTKTFTAVFTPADTTNYKTVEVDVTVTVSLASPVYTEPTAKENLVYNGNENALVNAGSATGGTMMYALGADGTTAPTDGWDTELPVAANVGTYYVWYKVAGDSNHSDVAPVCITVSIAKKQITKPGEDSSTFIYNGNDQTYAIDENVAYVIANNVQKNVGSYTVTVTLNDTDNYEWADGTTAALSFTFEIEQKEIGIAWSDTSFTYNATAQGPTATATGVVSGEQITLTVDGAQTNASVTSYTATVTGITGEHAGNYKLPGSVTTGFTIAKADQTAPGVGKTDETISKKADGTITAVDSTMEYRADGEDTYTVITGNTIENLTAGKYYVRVKGDDNHNPSPETAVNIAAGRKLKITVPQNQIGYTLTSDVYEIDYLGNAVLTYVLNEGYSEEANFSIALNGNSDGTWTNGQLSLSGIDSDVNIVVEGVVDNTAPEAKIDIKGNKWTSFLNNVTFGLFFKETQDVTITATDAGSGVNTIEYYLSDTQLSLDEVKAITDWEDYNGTFKINPDNKYVVYAKTTDNAGNAQYVNSNGIVLDKTEAVVNGLVNGETYYGQLTFSVDDSLSGIDTVEIDGTDKTNSEGQYVINPDNQEHTVTVTDKAGNVTGYTITVYKNYTVTFKADGNTVHTETVGHGKDATMPTIPAKEGYTQTTPAWDKDGKNITADTEINAVYTINKYTVTYKVDGQAVDTQTIEHGANAAAPEIPAKEGYTQTAPAWDKDGKNITADTEINAVYTINKYTVTYKADGQVVETVTVEHGKDATAPGVPAKEGYTQTAPAWDKDGKNITADTEINAVYTINKYTVTYKADGQVVDIQTIEHGKNATAPEIPAKEGYTQTAPAWDKDGKNITADTEINAVYTINKYTVTYKADGQVVETVTVEHGKDATAPGVPAKEGYTQTAPAWDKDGKNITSDTEINAVYTINKYTVTYKADGQVVDTQTIEHGADAAAPEIPAKEGYTQTVPTWDKNGKNIKADTEINAVYTINKYTVTYKADGQVVETVTVEHGKDATAPAVPTKEGYTQTAPAWDKDGKNITADTEINAVYTINKYTVTYKADGEVVDTQTIEHGADAAAPEIPAKEGYDQTAPAWDKDGKNVTADTEINAVYTINEYTITFMSEDGVYKTLTYKHGEIVQMPAVPEKDGYTVHWETTIDKATGDVIVKAVYTEIPEEEETEEITQGAIKSPKTGDDSNLWLLTVLILVSSMLFVTILRKKKEEA